MPNGQEKNGDSLAAASWADRFDTVLSTQAIQSAQIAELIKGFGTLEASVRMMFEQQKTLFGRANRPLPLGAIVGAVTLIIIGAGLLIAPVNRDISALRAADIRDAESMLIIIRQQGHHDANIEWFKELEDRADRRIHAPLK